MSQPAKSVPLVVGVVADTHIPDRVKSLHPGLIPALRAAGVARILHAGDVCSAQVLRDLEQVAQVDAVQGNRDWLFNHPLPAELELEIGGVKVALAHGHGNMLTYWMDKFEYIRDGYRLERYYLRILRKHPDARVLVFGHTHYAENQWLDGRLVFNPGSASITMQGDLCQPSYGLLRIFPDGRLEGEIRHLQGLHVRDRQWVDEGCSGEKQE